MMWKLQISSKSIWQPGHEFTDISQRPDLLSMANRKRDRLTRIDIEFQPVSDTSMNTWENTVPRGFPGNSRSRPGDCNPGFNTSHCITRVTPEPVTTRQ